MSQLRRVLSPTPQSRKIRDKAQYSELFSENADFLDCVLSPCVFADYLSALCQCGLGLEPFIGVEIHMEMDMEWKWMEMGHNLSKCYGLVWIWGKAINLKR